MPSHLPCCAGMWTHILKWHGEDLAPVHMISLRNCCNGNHITLFDDTCSHEVFACLRRQKTSLHWDTTSTKQSRTPPGFLKTWKTKLKLIEKLWPAEKATTQRPNPCFFFHKEYKLLAFVIVYENIFEVRLHAQNYPCRFLFVSGQ